MNPITKTNSTLLNIIRFLCSQGVVVGHLAHFFGYKNSFLRGIASYCVLLFFILSGFLISYSIASNLNKKPNYNFKSFFIDRFFRIYPPFVAALILVFILDFAAFSITMKEFSWYVYVKNTFINLFQLQEYPIATILNKCYGINFFYFPYLGTNLPLWTISIEWWLYMFYGFIVFYIYKNKKIGIKELLLLSLLAISPVYYLFTSTHMGKGLTIFWFLGNLITPSLNIPNNIINFNKASFRLSLIILFMGMYGFLWFDYTTSALIFMLGLFLIINIFREENKAINSFLYKISEKLSSYSYSLYLIHYSILCFIMVVFKINLTALNFLLLLILVNIISYGFAQLFEVRTKKIKLLYENYRSKHY